MERAKHLYTPQINYISTVSPPVPPLTQYEGVPEVIYQQLQVCQF